MLIDTHAHLSDEIYGGANGIIESMLLDGLGKIISVAYDLESALISQKLAAGFENVYFTAGIHPSNTSGLKNGYLDELKKLASDSKCVAIGEIGLDYHYDNTDIAAQKKALSEQLDIVGEVNLPVVFHLRDAYEDMFSIVKDNLRKMPKKGVMHCFSGSLETALSYIDMGFYISFSGAITFKNAKKFPEIIKALPKDRVLAETDCPYLAPSPYRGQTNYPKYVKYVVETLAVVWGIDYEKAAEITTQNAFRLFDKMKK